MVKFNLGDPFKNPKRLPSNYEHGSRTYSSTGFGHDREMGAEADSLNTFSTQGYLTPRQLQSQLIEMGHSIDLKETKRIIEELERSGSIIKSRVNNRVEYKISTRGEDRMDYLEDYEHISGQEPKDQSFLARPFG